MNPRELFQLFLAEFSFIEYPEAVIESLYPTLADESIREWPKPSVRGAELN
jgi:hypothetical protein